MRRDQLEHAIRAACQIIGHPEVIVVGSQSILGTYSEDELPAEATMSLEVDILPIANDNAETARLADAIEGSQASSRRSRSYTGSASTALTWRRLPFQKVGATDWSRCTTQIQPPRKEVRSSPVGAWTKKTCVSPSSARSERRTVLSSPRSCQQGSSTNVSSRVAWLRSRTAMHRRRLMLRTG